MAGNVGRWTNAFLNDKREIGDKPADDAATALFASGQVAEANDLLRAMVGIDDLDPDGLPPEVNDFLATTLKPPTWACDTRIGRAQDFFHTWGLQICACLFCASLPSSYAAAKGVQVLALTARLETDTRRRVFETGQFLMDVMSSGGLDEHGKGIKAIRHVRLMHAAIRHLIREREKTAASIWDLAAWGEPINQEDLAATLMSFALVPAEPLRRLGIEVSDQEAEDYLHVWKVVGHLLGIQDEMLPRDVADATAFVRAVKRRQFKPSQEGRELTAALIALLDDMTPTRWADRFIPMLMRHLIGNDVAKVVGLPTSAPTVLRWLPRPFGRVLSRGERIMQKAFAESGVAEEFGRQALQAVYDHQRRGINATFDMPTELANTWGITR